MGISAQHPSREGTSLLNYVSHEKANWRRRNELTETPLRAIPILEIQEFKTCATPQLFCDHEQVRLWSVVLT